MENTFDLAYPIFVAMILGYLGYKTYYLPESNPGNIANQNNQQPENISIRVYINDRDRQISIHSGITGTQLVQNLFEENQLVNYQPVLVLMGRRLDMHQPLNMQGVRNLSVLHAQLVSRTTNNESEIFVISSYLFTLVACGLCLVVFWYFFFTQPNYFSNFSKLALLAFSVCWGGVFMNHVKH